MVIQDKNTIQVEYEGRLEDGTLFDSSSKHGQPLEFIVGAHQVIKGFEEGVIGMDVGEEKEIKIMPDKGYGPYNEQLVKKVPRNTLKEDNIQKGMFVQFNLPNAVVARAQIQDVTPETITLDLNHPLAGKTLIFKIKIVSIS
jgi:FKBP-type peptidyl-prolyl cis-trans isomerase 2